MVLFFLLILIAAGIYLCRELWMDINKEAIRERRRERLYRKRVEEFYAVDDSTKYQLYALVDEHTAQRLVRHTRQQHPNRGDQWIWEKVILDLERDRRA